MTEKELAEIEARQFVDGIKHPSQTKDDIRRLLDEARRLRRIISNIGIIANREAPAEEMEDWRCDLMQISEVVTMAIGFPLPPEPSQPT